MPSLVDTARLSLRPLAPEDAAFLLELMNERPYLENIGDRGVRTTADAARYIEDKYISSYQRHGFGLYLVELREGSTPIGICGLVKRESLDHPDLGFAYLQRFWSQGYAREAAAGILGHARESLMLSHLHGLVSPRNTRSIRLLERLGMRYERALVLAGQTSESHIYGMDLKTA